MNAIGFDIGGTKILFAYAGENILEQIDEIKTPGNYESLLDWSASQIKLYDTRKIPAVGIGLAGVERMDGTIWCPNIPWLTGHHLAEDLYKETGCMVRIENDAHAALRGECLQGVLRGQKSALMLSLGTGIGAAVLADGVILSGDHGAAGAAGWLCLGIDGNKKPIYFDQAASGTGLGHMAMQAGFSSARELISECRHANGKAAAVLAEWTDILGTGIASLASIFDIGTIVLCGGLTREYDLFEKRLREQISQTVSPLIQKVTVLRSALMEKACLYGAIALSQQRGQ